MIIPTIPSMHAPLENFLSHCHKKRYPARTSIIHVGELSDTLYYLTKGSVSVTIEDDEGREMIMAYLNEGDFFGEMGLFDDENAERT
ncbi:MAG: cyclic nucleotide-binding domain-containing protein, partial [Alcanivorax sp.]